MKHSRYLVAGLFCLGLLSLFRPTVDPVRRQLLDIRQATSSTDCSHSQNLGAESFRKSTVSPTISETFAPGAIPRGGVKCQANRKL